MSSPEIRWPHIRYVDSDHPRNNPSGLPPSHFTVDCGPRERIVSVETIYNPDFGATTRVWIVADGESV